MHLHLSQYIHLSIPIDKHKVFSSCHPYINTLQKTAEYQLKQNKTEWTTWKNKIKRLEMNIP